MEGRRRDIKWRRSEVDPEERSLRNGHNPGIVMFLGKNVNNWGVEADLRFQEDDELDEAVNRIIEKMVEKNILL